MRRDEGLTDGFERHVLQRLAALERRLELLGRQNEECMDVAEFARRVGRAAYTVREWCRLGRIEAARSLTGCGPYRPWMISNAEFRRYRAEGLRQAGGPIGPLTAIKNLAHV